MQGYYTRMPLSRQLVLGPDTGEGMSTSILYNLCPSLRDQGEDGLAKDAYEKLLSRHPEYVDGKLSF